MRGNPIRYRYFTSYIRHAGENPRAIPFTGQGALDGKVRGLMEAMALDSAGYTGTYKLIGGRVALDLVNTISWPNTGRRHDWFDPPDNITAWLGGVRLEPVAFASSEVAAVCDLRDSIANIMRPLAHGERPRPHAADRFNEYLAAANSRRYVDPSTLSWCWPRRRLIEAFDPVLIDAAELVTSGDQDRLKHCPSCDWLFQDQTRNGRRRWCDMADCGSRAKARSYYHRHK